MYLKNGSNLLKVGSNVLQNGENLILKFNATNRFPTVTDINNLGYLQLVFTQSTPITINYGNGVTQVFTPTYNAGLSGYVFYIYDRGSNNSASLPYYATAPYYYPDGLTIPRAVTINFNRSLLKVFYITLLLLSPQDLIFGFNRYPNLQTFYVGQVGAGQTGAINNMDLYSVNTLPYLTTLAINTCFSSISQYRGIIPFNFFSLPLISLSVGDAGFTSTVPFSTSNLDKIYLFASTLKTLVIQGAALNDTNSGQGALPSNFNLLVNLTQLSVLTSQHTTIPAVVNSITSLVTIIFAYTQNLVSYGDISALINLTTLDFTVNQNLPATIPSGWVNLTKLKTIRKAGNLITQTNVDTFVSNFYSFITANASMIGTSANAFRSMTIYINANSSGDGTQIPTGTYQQPTGYVTGSSNGTPASSKEMIWVMVNQYSHIWTYRTV